MQKTLTFYDYIVLTLVLVISLLIGLHQVLKQNYARLCISYKNKVKHEKNKESEKPSEIKNYLIAGGTMSTMPIAFSLLATHFSGNVLLGFPAEVYQYGIQFWMMAFGLVLTPIAGALLTGPLFLRLKVMSVFEYLRLRYNSNIIRLLGVLCYFIRIVLSTSMYIYGPSTTINALSSINPIASIILIGSVATFYTCIGGIRAVIWTDFFQVIIMFTGMLSIIGVGVYNVGGFKNLWLINYHGGRLNFFDFDLNPFIRQGFFPLVIGTFGQFSLQYCIDQQMVQRFLSAKSKRTAQTAVLLNVPGIVLLISICCFTGLVVFSAYAQCDPITEGNVKHVNQILPYFVSEKLHVINGVNGLFLGAVFAAALSSVSSTLNSLSSILWEDLLKRWRFFKKLNDKQSTFTTKLLVVICGTLCTCLGMMLTRASSNIIQISGTINGALSGPIVGVFLLSSMFSFSNVYGASIGVTIGLMTGLWLSFGAFFINPRYPKLGVSTECCNTNLTCLNEYFYENSTLIFNLNKHAKEASNVYGFEKVYSISYHYFSIISIVVTIIIGILVSLITKGYKKKADRAFMLYNFTDELPEKNKEAYESVDLDEIEFNKFTSI